MEPRVKADIRVSIFRIEKRQAIFARESPAIHKKNRIARKNT